MGRYWVEKEGGKENRSEGGEGVQRERKKNSAESKCNDYKEQMYR